MVDRERGFCEALSRECERLGVASRAVAAASGVSESTLSRYRTGRRTPGPAVIECLARALADLAGDPDEAPAIACRLRRPLEEQRTRDVELCRRIDALMREAGLTNADLARAVRVDPSYISRIRAGARVPADPEAFAAACARAAARRVPQTEEALLARLLRD